ncbi:hypothetical protein [Bacillus sp. LL01]|nr:hypothetical protein [Bacillus sp. LL01]
MNYYHYSGQNKPTTGQVNVISSKKKSKTKKKSSGCGCGKKTKVIQQD